MAKPESDESAAEFTSLRKKLVLRLGLTYLAALVFVFVLIIVKNTFDFNAAVDEIETRTKASLINKGMLLVNNNSNALIGLVDDNAFTAVEQIVSKTVVSDEDIVYGIFSDLDNNDWVSAFKSKELTVFKSAVDANAEWAFSQIEAASQSIQFGNVNVLEFAAPVLLNETPLGVIRYGLSTEVLVEAIESANEKATQSLVQTLIGLTLVGLITLIVTFWRTDQVARKITVPLKILTDAADVVASGQYDQLIDVETNDEIGLLANNFRVMTNTIKRTIGDLDEINKIGSNLAKTRGENDAFNLVLSGLLKHLPFSVGLFFYVSPDNSGLNYLTYLQKKATDDVQDKTNMSSLVHQISNHPTVSQAIRNGIEEHEFFSTQLCDTQSSNSDQLAKCQSLTILPFGQRRDGELFLILLADSVDKEIAKTEVDFCVSISHLLATSLQNINMTELLEIQNKTLEDKVAERTKKLNVQNEALSETLKELEQAQNQLVEAEKMASLGSLVAGISHEVNTPLGVSVTAASHLNEQTLLFNEKFKSGALTKSGLTTYLGGASEATEIILTNLERAATLIQSFKQIAVDQSSDVKTEFNVMQHLDSLIVSLRPTYKMLPINIILLGDHQIKANSYPGLLTQVVTNLVVNSIKHGLAKTESGEIKILLEQQGSSLLIVIEDNGVGIADNIKSKVFDPFFTTSRGTGGSGLGLNIVYNLVKQKLGGDILLEDNQPNGARFIVSFPSGLT